MSSPLLRAVRKATHDDKTPTGHGEAHASALRSRIAAKLESARALPEIQASILLELRQRLDELAHDGDHTREWKAKREQEVRADAMRALDGAEQVASEAVGEAHDLAHAATVREPASVAEAHLLEAQIGNAWAAMRMHLDSAKGMPDTVAAIERACASAEGDAVKIEALRRYGDDWLVATFPNEPRVARERVQAAMHAAIDAAEAPSLTPLQRTGRAILAEVDHGVGYLLANGRDARNEIERQGKTAALAAWGEGDAPILFANNRGWYTGEHVAANFGEPARLWALQAQRAYPRLTGNPTDDDKRAARMLALTGMDITNGGQQ
jgi:hypothetical protein